MNEQQKVWYNAGIIAFHTGISFGESPAGNLADRNLWELGWTEAYNVSQSAGKSRHQVSLISEARRNLQHTLRLLGCK